MKKGVIEKNIINGPYDDVNHYVKIHFSLLKEDFEEPLRASVMFYKKQKALMSETLKNIDIKVYKGVTVSFNKSKKKSFYYVNFLNPFQFSGVDWNTSKNFMHGSLVLLSNDNFNKLYLAIVEDRYALEKGKSWIRVNFLIESPPCSKRNIFVMLECKNFFEPYYQVLTALLNLSVKNFPMYKYIISSETSKKLPAYVNRETVYKICGHNIQICNPNDWPVAEKLRLNDSQLQAIQTALTSEFSLIQGPPGTGKTYTCLMIIDILLNNINFCKMPHPNPILIVCFKNHALDQILGSLLKKNVKVLRIVPGIKPLLKAINERWHSLERLQKEINKYNSLMSHLDERSGIVSFAVLSKGLTNLSQNQQTWLRNNFINWLFCDISSQTDINKVIELCSQTREDIKAGKLSVVQNPPVSKNGSTFEILQICDTFENDSVMKQLSYSSIFILSLNDLEITMNVLRESIYFKCRNKLNVDFISDVENELKLFNDCRIVYLTLKERINTRASNVLLIKNNKLDDLNSLNVIQRWRLYQYWVKELRRYYQRRANSFQREYEDDKVMFDELGNVKKAIKIERFGAQVIGATTTSAARCQHLLTLLKPKIGNLEKAAELLEAHAVVSLSKHCQHVILIGDHQQLRPSTASYRLETDFNLGVSLFERMIKNGLHAPMLTVQHRMRPEISALITPSIYSKLDNHATVCNLPDVMGIVKNVYFIDHNNFENEMDVSKMNIHECDLLLNLCKYLLQQGYDASEITILATYLAQKTYMLSARERLGLPTEITITSVDNFQGEENRIILLSLVRCNEDNKVGFLSVENRICVALSRAKEGLYVAGNMPSLIANSKVWAQINQKETIDPVDECTKELQKLALLDYTEGDSTGGESENFDLPKCNEPCGIKLKCGHTCKKKCHVNEDPLHDNYVCHEICGLKNITCPLKHKCKKECYQQCGECVHPCKKLLSCGHSVKRECHISVKDIEQNYKCLEICNKKLRCGHCCIDLCSEPCGLCKEMVIMNGCGHKILVKCGAPLSACNHSCDKLLQCGHKCKGKCSNQCDNGIYLFSCYCKELCKATLGCGHRCTGTCGESHLCKQKCRFKCRHGKCMARCSDPCMAKCGVKCARKCSHFRCKRKCWEQCDTKCLKDCPLLLPCGHPCQGYCGYKCPPVCTQCDK
uniref:NF-X1-type domain-containing protein n=1 Tax=Rhodnius prolixus TaxID=13249 RepID=T1IDH6_RHOPR